MIDISLDLSGAHVLWNAAVTTVTVEWPHRAKLLLLFRPSTATTLLFSGTVFLTIIAAALYVRHKTLRHWQIAVSCLSVPTLVLIITMAKPALQGVPDERCPQYGDGKVEFRLLTTPSKVPIEATRPFGDSWLVLTVEAQSLWGMSPHLCRVSLRDEKNRLLYRMFRDNAETIADNVARNGSTDFTFTFGNAIERPNVRPGRGDPIPNDKTGPPERAQGI